MYRTSSPPYPIMSVPARAPFTYQPCASMQPFGMPVVPDVYMIESSDAGPTSPAAGDASSRENGTVSTPATVASSSATAHFSEGSSDATSATVAAPGPSTTIVSASQSPSW